MSALMPSPALRASFLVAAIAALGACGDSAAPKPEASTAPAATTAATTTAPSAAATETAAPTPAVTATADTSASATAQTSAKPVASAGSTAKAEGGEPVKGEEKTGAAYSAYMTGAKSYKAGQPGTVTAIVNALGDYHVNPEFPYKVKLDAPSGDVSFPSDTVRDVARTEKRATMSIPFTATSAGTKTISGTCSLSVCTKDQCVIEKVPLSVTVKVD